MRSTITPRGVPSWLGPIWAAATFSCRGIVVLPSLSASHSLVARIAREQVRDLGGGRAVTRRDRPAALHGALGVAEVRDDRAHRVLLAHTLDTHQDLHRLGVGVELAQLLRQLKLRHRGAGHRHVVAEDVVRQLVGHQRVQVARVEHADVDVEIALPVSAADAEIGARLDAHAYPRNPVGLRRRVGEAPNVVEGLLLLRREGDAVGQDAGDAEREERRAGVVKKPHGASRVPAVRGVSRARTLDKRAPKWQTRNRGISICGRSQPSFSASPWWSRSWRRSRKPAGAPRPTWRSVSPRSPCSTSSSVGSITTRTRTRGTSTRRRPTIIRRTT